MAIQWPNYTIVLGFLKIMPTWPYFVIQFIVDFKGWDKWNNLCRTFVLETLGTSMLKDVKTWPFAILPMFWQIAGSKSRPFEVKFYQIRVYYFIIILNNIRNYKIVWPCERYFHKFQENGRKCGFMTAIIKATTGQTLYYWW